MNYIQYIAYHKRGDAGVEERMISHLCRHFCLQDWDKFRLIYFYAMTYHIPSALDMLLCGERDIKRLKFRTDRRYVRCNGAFPKMLEGLTQEKHDDLRKAKTTQEAYDIVHNWFFFGRYASYLFLETYCNVFSPNWEDNVKYNWEDNENYTKGAISITHSKKREVLDGFLNRARADTRDNAFSIETSLCAVEKINKGTRWDGYYTERMLEDANGTKYMELIYRLAR